MTAYSPGVYIWCLLKPLLTRMGKSSGHSGLLRRPKTITKLDCVPKNVKPVKARRLIRLFHSLQKHKYTLTKKLNENLGLKDEINVENFEDYLSRYYPLLFTKYEALFSKEQNNKEECPLEARLGKLLTTEEVLSMLAYIKAKIIDKGGMEAYQVASTQGQEGKRGGDSLGKLVEWLIGSKSPYKRTLGPSLKALEIGSLNPYNKISVCGIFDKVTRIDLKSQDVHIIQQDFMKMPLPKGQEEKFNLISCSLVLNFVPSPKERGDMLRRMTHFLVPPNSNTLSSLFLVLPLPCIENSRYCDQKHLESIMTSLGFSPTRFYPSKKLAYWLFDWNGSVSPVTYPKTPLHSGSRRNNFAVVLS